MLHCTPEVLEAWSGPKLKCSPPDHNKGKIMPNSVIKLWVLCVDLQIAIDFVQKEKALPTLLVTKCIMMWR